MELGTVVWFLHAREVTFMLNFMSTPAWTQWQKQQV